MNFDDYMRIFVGACAAVGTFFVIRGIVTGRWPIGRGSSVTRAEDAKTYWLLVARYVCSMVGLGLAAMIVPERMFGPVCFLILLAPALAFALITGRFDWEANDKRIETPRRFWRWVTFYAVMNLLFVIILFREAFKAS